MLDVSWGGCWHPHHPVSYPKCSLVTFHGRVYISIHDVPRDVSISNKDYWRMVCNTYELLKEV